jgi:hypothetical protein
MGSKLLIAVISSIFVGSLFVTQSAAQILCVNEKTHVLKVNSESACPRGETKVDPVTLGLQGPQGIPGPGGPQGEKGPTNAGQPTGGQDVFECPCAGAYLSLESTCKHRDPDGSGTMIRDCKRVGRLSPL